MRTTAAWLLVAVEATALSIISPQLRLASTSTVAEIESLAMQVAQLREDGIDNHATVIRRTECEMCAANHDFPSRMSIE